jgi:hypothetical protein
MNQILLNVRNVAVIMTVSEGLHVLTPVLIAIKIMLKIANPTVGRRAETSAQSCAIVLSATLLAPTVPP